MCKKKKANVLYIIAFMIPVLMMIIMIYKAKAYPFGDDHTILIGDTQYQHVHFYRMLFDRIAEHKSFLFSWDAGMGFDFYTCFWYYLANPVNLIILLFGKNHIELGMICSIMIQVGGCSVTALYYLLHSKINKMKDEKWNLPVCLLFSTAYAMCDYILAYRFNVMWLMGMMLIPLLMLGVEYLVDKQDARLYGILLFLGFISNYYYAWFLCIWSVICFIEQEKKTFFQWKKAFIQFVGTSVLSALCASAILLPSYLSALGRKSEDWFTLSDFKMSFHASVGDFINGFFWGHSMALTGDDFYTQNNYCGIFTIILVCLYCFNQHIDLKQKVKRIVEIAVLVLAMNWIGAYWLLHGGTIPHMYSNRFAILLIFLLIMTAYEGLYQIDKIRFRYYGITCVILIVCYLLAIFKGSLTDNLLCYLVTMFLITIVFICLFLYRRNSIKKGTMLASLCILGFAELLLNPLFSNADTVTVRTEQLTGNEDMDQLYQELQTESGERKTAYMMHRDLGFSWSQTDIFSSSIQSGVIDLFHHIGLLYGDGQGNYIYQGTTPLVSTLLNVRYVITDSPNCFGGYNKISIDGSFDVLESEYLSGIGFMLPEAAEEWNVKNGNVFEVQNQFSNKVLGKQDLFSRVELGDFDVVCSACSLIWKEEDQYLYLNQDAISDVYATMLFSGTVPEDMDLYMYSDADNYNVCSIYLDDQLIYEDDADKIWYNANVRNIHIGKIGKGQKLEVMISDMSERQEEAQIDVYFYQYHEDVMQECLLEMKQSVYEIETFEDTYISGTVDVKDNGILYTSIPYFKGFTVYVDGKKEKAITIGNAMMGVRLTAGRHKVEFRYFTYGLKTGIVMSLLGFVLLLCRIVYLRRKRSKSNDVGE